MMKQSKFPWADVLMLVAAIVFGFFCFMGANFMNIDNDKVWGMNRTLGCIAIAFFCSGVLLITAYGAKLLKRTDRNFKTFFIFEMITLVCFALFAVFLFTKFSPFTHYFTVSAQKSEIKIQLQESISQAKQMFLEYGKYAEARKNRYKAKLDAAVKHGNSDTLIKMGFTKSIPYKDQVATKLTTLDYELFPSNYSDSIARNGLKEVAADWLLKAEETARIWKPIGIVAVVNDIEKNSKEWLDELVMLSQFQSDGEVREVFKYELSFGDVRSHFIQLDNPKPLAIILATFLYALMLLSWFITKRSTKSEGALTTKPYEVVL